jgi:hypothetical protein
LPVTCALSIYIPLMPLYRYIPPPRPPALLCWITVCWTDWSKVHGYTGTTYILYPYMGWLGTSLWSSSKYNEEPVMRSAGRRMPGHMRLSELKIRKNWVVLAGVSYIVKESS